jgi:hypothetical protein
LKVIHTDLWASNLHYWVIVVPLRKT